MLLRLAAAITTYAPLPTPSLTPAPTTSPGASPPPAKCPNPDQCAPPKIDGDGGWLGFDPMEKMANSLREGTIWVLERLATFWTDVDVPDISANPEGASNQAVGSVAWLQGQLHWFVGASAMLGLLLAAGRMAWQRRAEPLQQALNGLFTLVVVTGCSVAAVSLACEVGDQYSEWIVNAALDKDVSFGGRLNQMLWGGGIANSTGLVIVLFLLCILASLAQIAMLYIRYAMLGLLVGVLPLAASLSVIPEGKSWFKKMTGWLVAFVLYKPTAATIYAFAFVSMKEQDGTSQIIGIILIVLAVVALPALMRFVVPMVAAAGGGGGDMAMAGGLGALAGRAAASGGGADGGADGGGPSGARQVGGAETPSPPPAPEQEGPPPESPPTPAGSPEGDQPPAGQSPAGQDPPAGGPPGQSPAGEPPSGGAQASTSSSGLAGTAGVAGVVVEGGKRGLDAAQGAAKDATGEGGPDGSG